MKYYRWCAVVTIDLCIKMEYRYRLVLYMELIIVQVSSFAREIEARAVIEHQCLAKRVNAAVHGYTTRGGERHCATVIDGII